MHDDLACMICSVLDVAGRPDVSRGPTDGPDDRTLSVIVLFDHPFDLVALDEALFSLAAQDWERIEVVVTLPDCGPAMHHEVEDAVTAQSWPEAARAQVISVTTPARRVLSADLMNAGIARATGRYIAFLHHQDLIYQHAYPTLIGGLEESASAVAIGGVRLAHHADGLRHWLVTNKQPAPAGALRLGPLVDGTAAAHRLVIDRHALPAGDLFVHHPTSDFAVAVFLIRLAMHPKADFSMATIPVCEIRRAPHPASRGDARGGHRLLDADALIASLEGGDLVLRNTALLPNILLAEVMKASDSRFGVGTTSG